MRESNVVFSEPIPLSAKCIGTRQVDIASV